MIFRTFIALLALAPAVPAHAAERQWQAAETEHFIIYSKSPQERIEELAADLEIYDRLMRMATATRAEEPAVKVRIYEVGNIADIERALGVSNTGIAGFYTSNVLGPYLVTPRTIEFETSAGFTPRLVLHHEYAHHFMLQYFPAVYPDWYVEGFAELIASSKRMPDGRIGYGMPAKHRGAYIAANWVSLQELLASARVTDDFDPYGQGWALTHFFTFAPGRSNQLRAYLDALAEGKPMKEAAQVFGDLGALNRDARRYVTAGFFNYRPVKVDIAQPVIRRTTPLSAAEAELIPEVIAFEDDPLDSYRKPATRERHREQRETNLQRIREKANLYPGDPFALYFLAEAENASGNYAQAQAATDRLLAIQPAHVRALARKSMLLSRQAGTLQGPPRTALVTEARALAVRANKADISDPLPLIAYYESYRLVGEKAPEAALEGLMQAVSTLPRDTGLRLRLVNELEGAGRYAEAIDWIMPIANDPHDSPLRSAAKEQLERLRQELARAQSRSAG
jgi:tetratricopeptide (TPR) repeat protein